MPDYDEAHDALVDHRKNNPDKPIALMSSTQEQIATLIELVQHDSIYFFSSIPATSFKEKMQLAKMMQGKTNDIETIMEPNYFMVHDFILTKASFTDKDEENVTTPKLVLISKEKTVCNILAKVWITEFLSLLQTFGLPPWEEEIVVSAKQMKGNGTNRYYSLVIP